MGKYNEALLNAKEALKLNSYLTDFKLYKTKDGTWGRVCLITDNTVRFPELLNNKESIWIRLGSASSSALNAEVYASDDLQNVYKQDLTAGSEDKRRSLFFLDGASKFGTKTVLFPGRVLWAPYVEINMGLNTAELFLTAAECEARIGDKVIAMQHINTLRNSRITNNQPLIAASNDEALLIVLRERRREMPFSGNTRLIDLKRLNKEARFAKTITHKQGETVYTLPANDKRYVLPLPPKVIDFNPSIPLYDR
jgi:hypothetical protein